MRMWSTLILLAALVAGMTFADTGDPAPKEAKPKYTPEQMERARSMLRPGEKPLVRPTEFPPVSLPFAQGVVIAVDKTHITLRAFGKTVVVAYPLHDALAAGRLQACATYSNGYLASDLLVGDVVSLSICDEDGKKFVADICIEKRPGGRVPESSKPGQQKPKWAMRKNAQNDLDDFGIPIPDSCRSPFELRTPAQFAEERRVFAEFQSEFFEMQRQKEEAAKKEKK